MMGAPPFAHWTVPVLTIALAACLSGRGVRPWGGFGAAVKHWESHKNKGGE